ncbi:MAG: hypothetical protein DRZ76_04570 [Candidatus Nealsonbacteria bacterium]|nr:MAG: hypothetical protein DRZ76_04570 [Candidatus Nealsonbacteria bacterium]
MGNLTPYQIANPYRKKRVRKRRRIDPEEKRQRQQETLEKVKAVLEKGATIANACYSAGISVMTLWRWRRESKQVDLFIRNLIDGRVQLVEDALYKKALEGNVAAQIFYLKNHGWRDTPLIDQSEHKHIKIVWKVAKNGHARDYNSRFIPASETE